MVHLSQNHTDINVLKKKFNNKKQILSFVNLLSKNLNLGDIIFLKGDLGVGKTFLAKEIIKSISGDLNTSSPTYNIINTHEINAFNEIWHCDFYRVNSNQEVFELGVFDNISSKIIIVEWPKFYTDFNLDPLIIEISFGKNYYQRNFKITFSTKWRKQIFI